VETPPEKRGVCVALNAVEARVRDQVIDMPAMGCNDARPAWRLSRVLRFSTVVDNINAGTPTERTSGIISPEVTIGRTESDEHPEASVEEPGRDTRTGAPNFRRLPWAQLLARVFLADALACPRCGARMRILAAIQDPDAIRSIL
jgi:hypothetical protein